MNLTVALGSRRLSARR